MRSEILGLPFNTLTANYERSRNNTGNLSPPLRIHLCGIQETLSSYFIAIFESALNFQHFEKIISVIPQVFQKFLTPKDVFTKIHKRSCYWKLFHSERVNESLKPLISERNYFSATFSSFLAKLNYKKSFLVRSAILIQLVNTLTANYEYSRNDMDNLLLPVQMQLSLKLKIFSDFFIAFFWICIKL